MVTEANKVAAQTFLPTGTVKVGKQEWEAPKALCQLVAQGADLYKGIKELQKELAECNQDILAHVPMYLTDQGTMNVQVGEAVCTVKKTDSVAIDKSKYGDLKTLLGERFADLTKEAITYKPERKLIEMATAETELAKQLLPMLTIETGKPTVSYK